MKNVRDAQALVSTLEQSSVGRREILRLLFALDGGMIFESTLALCGFERPEVRAHLASLSFDGYDWSFSTNNTRVYHLTPPSPQTADHPTPYMQWPWSKEPTT